MVAPFEERSGGLTLTRNESDMLEFSRTCKVGFAKPEVWNVEIPFGAAANPHATLMQNFVNAILDGEPLIAPGEEGIHSVELANVMLYSSLIGQRVDSTDLAPTNKKARGSPRFPPFSTILPRPV